MGSKSYTTITEQATAQNPILSNTAAGTFANINGDATYAPTYTDQGAIEQAGTISKAALNESFGYAGDVAGHQADTVQGVLGLGNNLITKTSDLISQQADQYGSVIDQQANTFADLLTGVIQTGAESQKQAVGSVGSAYAASVQGGVDSQKLVQYAIWGAFGVVGLMFIFGGKR